MQRDQSMRETKANLVISQVINGKLNLKGRVLGLAVASN